MIFFILLISMGSSWLFRVLLLRTLRLNHPHEFAELGHPSNRQLASPLPRYQDLHLKFWKYLWGGKAFLVKDGLVSGLAWGALISDVALAGSVAALFLAAGK